MQGLNLRRRYLNHKKYIYWYSTREIEQLNTARFALSGASIDDGCIFAGGGQFDYGFPSSTSGNINGYNSVEYFNKFLVKSDLDSLNGSATNEKYRWAMGSAVLEYEEIPQQDVNCTFQSINMSSIPSGGYAYATINNSSTQHTSGSITLTSTDSVTIHLNRTSGNSGVYLYRNKGEAILDPTSMSGNVGDITDMPDYHEWGASLTYTWNISAVPSSLKPFNTTNIIFENDNNGYLNCTILLSNTVQDDQEQLPVIKNKKVFFIGGSYPYTSGTTTRENVSADIDIYSFPGATHSTSSLSTSRSYFGCTTLDNNILIGGGISSKSINRLLNTVVMYNASGVATNLTNLSSARYRVTALSNNNYAMFAGGSIKNDDSVLSASSNIDIYSKTGTKIESQISLSNSGLASYGPSSASFKDNFIISTYSLLGNGMSAFNKDLISINIDSSTNKDLSLMGTLDNYLLVAGGRGVTQLTESSNIYVYNKKLIVSLLSEKLTNSKYDGAYASISGKYGLFAGKDGVVDIVKVAYKASNYLRITTAGTSSTSSRIVGSYITINNDTSPQYSKKTIELTDGDIISVYGKSARSGNYTCNIVVRLDGVVVGNSGTSTSYQKLYTFEYSKQLYNYVHIELNNYSFINASSNVTAYLDISTY